MEEVFFNARLTFPDREEFMLYSMATVLYEETGDELGLTYTPTPATCPLDRAIPSSKEMVAVAATKNGTAPDR